MALNGPLMAGKIRSEPFLRPLTAHQVHEALSQKPHTEIITHVTLLSHSTQIRCLIKACCVDKTEKHFICFWALIILVLELDPVWHL